MDEIDRLLLEILQQSGGMAVESSDESILKSLLKYAQNDAILLSPEGAAATAAYDQLIEQAILNQSDRVVIFNTGAGLKYADVLGQAMHLERPATTSEINKMEDCDHRGILLPAKSRVGGIITPQ